jgi:PIN domain nuclease of toxin-antitoxin system
MIREHEEIGIGVSCISCWEVAKLVELGRLAVSLPVAEWLDLGAVDPGIQLLHLTPQIAVASTQLPGDFHKDPADQIIVATARTLDCPLLTEDQRILQYPHVETP